MLPDLAEQAAWHEAGHAVVAMVLGWSIGDVSLQKTAIRPNRHADERRLCGDLATICAAGDIALRMKFAAVRKSDRDLMELLAGAPSRNDHAVAIKALAEDTPDLPPVAIVGQYRELEDRAFDILREQWSLVERIALKLLSKGTITRRERIWANY